MRKQLTFRLEVKSLTDEGTFEGDLSVYNVLDLGGDSVEPGAFTKTLKENGGRVPLLWQHDPKQPIGYLDLTDGPKSLKAKGTLILDVERAREAYALLKAGVLKGLSIGYESVKDAIEAGVRKLKEVKLYEGSVVTFPMLPVATVSSVKGLEAKADFADVLDAIQAYALRRQVLDALEETLYQIVWDYQNEYPTIADRVTASADAIDKFRTAYLEAMPRLLDQYGLKFDPKRIETKAGRKLSADSRAKVEGALQSLQTLLAEADAAEASTDETGAVKSQDEPADPSLIEQFKSQYERINSLCEVKV